LEASIDELSARATPTEDADIFKVRVIVLANWNVLFLRVPLSESELSLGFYLLSHDRSWATHDLID
jgi:hypothetical protein